MLVVVDGVTVGVQTAGALSDLDREALTALVTELRRRVLGDLDRAAAGDGDKDEVAE